MTDQKSNTSYLDFLFAGVTEGFLVVWHKSNKASRCFHVSQLDEARQYMLTASETDDVYWGWGLQENEPLSGRGGSNTVSVVGGLMMDIDVRAKELGVHSKNEHLPESWEEVLDLIKDAGIPEPTAIRHSGNGTYFDWVFDKPAVLDTGEKRKSLQDLSRRWQKLIIDLAGKKGWKLDTTSDLARVTRLPGTRNHKTSPAKPVTMLSLEPTIRYTIEELTALVASLDRKDRLPTTPRKPRSQTAVVPANDNEPNAPGSFDTVVAGCTWAKWTVDSSSNLPEPDWYAQASIVGRCADGRAKFHEISQADPRYDQTETERKLEHALTDAGPRTCANIADELGFDGCKRCPFFGKFGSPLQLSRVDISIVNLMRDHVFDIATGRYIELATRRALDEKAFSNKFRHETGKGTPHAQVISNRFTRKVDRADYLPGIHEIFTRNESGENVLNLWRPSSVRPEPGDFSVISHHLEFIYPRDDERQHLIDCLAHIVQKPQDKVKHVLLTIGAQGTGKSFVGTLISHIVGPENMWIAESHDLNDGWTAAMANKQVLSLEELGISDKRETYEALKRWITEETVLVNEKHVPKYVARTPRLILAFSNHQVPTTLQEGDRRWWVSNSEAQPSQPIYYERLWTEGLKQVPAFVHWLSGRNISHFRPSAPPPQTLAKSQIISWSRPVVQQEIESMMEQGTLPFHRDVVTAEEVRVEVASRVKGRGPSSREVTTALRAFGAVPLPQMRRSSARLRPWAWRNVEQWGEATADEIRRTFVSLPG